MIDSNELTRKIKTPLNPRAALIAYALENDRNFFFEIRGIDDRGNMTEGKTVTLEFMNALVKRYSERHSTTLYGKIPFNLLYCDLTYEKLLQYWERKFWLTEFTYLGGNGNPTRSNLVLVTKAARDRDLNLDELKSLNNMKPKDILK